MFCPKLLGSVLTGLAIASVASMYLIPARAEDRMQLGVAMSESAEFQSQVGDRVFFSEASADLGSRGRVALEAQAVWLARHPKVSVIIEGHADDNGADTHNLEVSEQRAETVRRRLIQMGVSPERIRTVAYGRARPIADCPAPACTAQNRRAVTVIGPAVDTADATSEPGSALRSTAARRSLRRLN
jgi:peptidoglycan-associated lipoprotein